MIQNCWKPTPFPLTAVEIVLLTDRRDYSPLLLKISVTPASARRKDTPPIMTCKVHVFGSPCLPASPQHSPPHPWLQPPEDTTVLVTERERCSAWNALPVWSSS